MKSYGTAKVSHEATQCSPTELKVMVACPFSNLFHFLCYSTTRFNRRTTCVSRLTATIPAPLGPRKTEEEFHARDLDSPSWYLKPGHDVIMTLSGVRTALPFKVISLHVSGHTTTSATTMTSSGPNNSMVVKTYAFLRDAIASLIVRRTCRLNHSTYRHQQNQGSQAGACPEEPS
jgi:hypothetical protein